MSKRGRTTRMVGLAAVMLGMLVQPPVAHSEEAAAEETEVTLESYEGVYMYAGGERQREAIRQEIDDATEDLNVALRAIARRKIWNSQKPSSRMTIVVDGDHVSIVRSGDKPKIEGTIGGDSVPFDGDYRARLKWRDGKIVVDISGGDQHTVFTFRLDPKTRKVTASTSISHPRLPRTVRVKKTFRALG